MKPWRPYLPVICTSWALTAVYLNLGNRAGLAFSLCALVPQPVIWWTDRRNHLARQRRQAGPPVDLVDAPSRAWVVLHDGTHVDCTLVRTGPRTWQARPVRPLGAGEVETALVNRLPEGASVFFDHRTTERTK